MIIKPAEQLDPLISVIIASYEPDDVLTSCLVSLRRQVTSIPFEIILVDSSSRFDVTAIKIDFPEVQAIHVNHRAFCGEARNLGLAHARGKLIAFLDADCEASPDWIERIRQAHDSPYAVIGGAIGNGNPQRFVGWAAYFCEFSQWKPGSAPRLLKDCPGANISYKRETLVRYGPFITGSYCSDSELHWRLRRHGRLIYFSPDILVRHHNITVLHKYLHHEFQHGRCFGRVRFNGEYFSGFRRGVHITFFFLLPFWRLAKLMCWNMSNRTFLLQMIASLPLIFLGLISWCLGETAGLLQAKRAE